jgi:hypothetical protein
MTYQIGEVDCLVSPFKFAVDDVIDEGASEVLSRYSLYVSF